jgi:hypothetical protein
MLGSEAKTKKEDHLPSHCDLNFLTFPLTLMLYRCFLFVLALCVPCNVLPVSAAGFTQGQAQAPFAALEPDDYVWKPEISASGPVVIIVSIPEQTLCTGTVCASGALP